MLRADKLIQDYDHLIRIMTETGVVSERIFNDDLRERLLVDAIEVLKNHSWHNDMDSILRDGWKGYADYTDNELANELFQMHCNDSITDEEFLTYAKGLYKDIELAVVDKMRDMFERFITNKEF